MKKITALLLVAVMVLASVSALAAGSPTPYGIGTSVYVPMTPAEPTVGIVDLGPTGTAYQTAVGNDENPYTDETKGQLDELFPDGYKTYDIVGLDLSKVIDGEGREIELEFATEYLAGTPVAAVLVIVNGESVAEYVLKAEVKEDYVVTVTFPADVLAAAEAASETFLAIVAK